MTAVTIPRMTQETLQRLTRYRALLDRTRGSGGEFVTLGQLGAAAQAPVGTVADDLRTGCGLDEVGYELDLDRLLASLDRVLGRDNYTDVFLAGTTPLAKSILACGLPERHGLNVAAVFDDDPVLTGQSLHGRPVLPLAKLPELTKRMHVHLGIIAVEEDRVQVIADLMALGSITGIICCAAHEPTVPPDVSVVCYDLAQSLHQLVNTLRGDLTGATA